MIFFFAWFLGGLINNITGFGAAMVAMPFIAALVPLEIAVPASTLIVLTLNLQMGWNFRHYIQWKRLRYLFFGGVLGTFVGLQLMQIADNNTLKLGMGVFMIAYAIYCLLDQKIKHARLAPGWGVLAGFGSTTLGALFGFNGPPLALYVFKSGWSQKEAKGGLAACFIMTGMTILTGQIMAGTQNYQTLMYYAAGCPGALIGGTAGLFISRFFSQRAYEKAIILLVLISGASISLSCL
nr:sulfite exporter TauE/SafE family protein [uncultured Pseudodesulfovibrio sp.]